MHPIYYEDGLCDHLDQDEDHEECPPVKSWFEFCIESQDIVDQIEWNRYDQQYEIHHHVTAGIVIMWLIDVKRTDLEISQDGTNEDQPCQEGFLRVQDVDGKIAIGYSHVRIGWQSQIEHDHGYQTEEQDK